MVNKKYLLLTSLCAAMAAQPVIAQESGNEAGAKYGNRDMTYRGENYDVLDSSYIPKGRMEQQHKFMNHQYNFPAKPRSMWEIGVNVGALNVIGDVTTKTPFSARKFTEALGYGLTVRKSIGYVFSLRAQFLHGFASGFEYRLSNPVNSPWSTLGYTGPIYENYRTTINEASLQLVAATNNIRFHKARNSFSLYGFAGFGLMNFNPKVDALDASGNKYNFASVTGYPNSPTYANRKATNDDLKKMLDGTYESRLASKESIWGSGKSNTSLYITGGLGIQFKLSSRVSLSFEDKVSYCGSDKMDAVYLQNNGGLSSDKDYLNYFSLGLGFNLGNKSKNVAPLWWMNPLDYVYGEVSDPRHMRLPEPILNDADGDGIADQFDKCPGTPANTAVDTHGCPMDTDGDGVPDFRDKELITPTECQPVDGDGVGKCPCHCEQAPPMACNVSAGTVAFAGNNSKISSAMQAQLATLAAQMQASPNCKVVLIGQGNASKLQQQRSWDRVNALQEYMSEKQGIDRNRFIFQYGQPGDPNSVMYRAAQPGEEGPSTVAPPHPQLSNQK